jgi:LPXTG-site transpeptidase (sortase) family protein
MSFPNVKRPLFLIIVLLASSILAQSVSAEASIPQQDQTPLAPLSSPQAPPAEPRYISGFGLDNTYTIFYEDRRVDSGCPASSYRYRIYFNQTSTGPFGFTGTSTATNICDSHFKVKNWPITIGGTTYAYRGWGAGTYTSMHNFYVSNDLIHWILEATFTFSHPSDEILYGFHDIIQLNGQYMGFVESAGGHTYIVSSPTGDQNWTVVAQVGGSGVVDAPLNLSFTSAGPIPTGDFLLMQVGGQMVYGKLMVPGNHSGAYLAINRTAAQAATPAAAETAFLNPANWTWADGSIGLPTAANRVLTSTLGAGGHDVHEVWTIPSSNPLSDNVILYIADYASIGGGSGIGCAARNAHCLIDTTPPTVTSISLQATYTSDTSPSNFTVTFSKDVYDPPGNTNVDDVTNPNNYLVVEAGPDGTFQTISCAGGATGDDTKVTVTGVIYNSGTDTSTVNFAAALPIGRYRLFVCGTTSIVDLDGNALAGNGTTSGTDYTFDFEGLPSSNNGGVINDISILPNTGFAQNTVTILPQQPADKVYTATDLSIEIPSLNLNLPIVGVPHSASGWDLSWLGNNAGWLNGTAFPTWAGNSVITGHVWNADNTPGVFLNLKDLKYGDQIKVHAFGQVYIYEVRESRTVWPDQTNLVFQHETLPYLTLLTCEDYRILWGAYSVRRMVRAVLVKTLSASS